MSEQTPQDTQEAAPSTGAAGAMPDNPGTADLVALIGDKSDDGINALIKELQPQNGGLIKAIFEGMEQRFLPDKAAGKSAVIQYDITSPEGTESWQVAVADGKAVTSQSTDKEANVVLTVGAPDFLRLVAGKLNGVQAFMSGKVKLKGDMMLAQSMQTWFDQS
ncbi:MAG: hypothetical protein QOE92_291 [Chloroflexota bacterium]|jgi:putative sterol carrier protein|nr:hypothetical protein [Chloroflexota bacterium]